MSGEDVLVVVIRSVVVIPCFDPRYINFLAEMVSSDNSDESQLQIKAQKEEKKIILHGTKGSRKIAPAFTIVLVLSISHSRVGFRFTGT